MDILTARSSFPLSFFDIFTFLFLKLHFSQTFQPAMAADDTIVRKSRRETTAEIVLVVPCTSRGVCGTLAMRSLCKSYSTGRKQYIK